MDAYSWLGIVILTLALGLFAFVAAVEAGLISISRARVRLMAGRNVPRAEILQSYMEERDSLLRALALARNLAVVASAGVSVAVLTRERGHDWTLIALAVVGAIALVALMEAVPRAVVASDPERWGLRLAPFIGAFKAVFGLPARILDLPVRIVTRGRPDELEEEEEMVRLIELEEEQGPLEEDERKMIRGVFGLEETAVREIMTPRTDIVALEAEASPQEAVRVIVERGFSRIPIYEGNLDRIAGIVYAKDLIRYLAADAPGRKLRDLARSAFFVPESKRVDDLLTEMRRQRVHMAIVVDEYGGTAGLATIEDLIEEIVGEIEDEHDRVAEQPIVRVSENEALLDGRVSIDDLNELFHTDIEADDFDTVGGCIVHLLGRMPTAGDEAAIDGLSFSVLAVDGHRVKRVRAVRTDAGAGAAEEDGRRSEAGHVNGAT